MHDAACQSPIDRTCNRFQQTTPTKPLPIVNQPNQSNHSLDFESDQRLPSGEWSGFYLENHQPRRGWMHLYINFHNSRIQGEGTDYVGPWIIDGSYDLDNQVCQWTKQYQGKHRVDYQGKVTENGIQGVWNIRNWNNGPFHIWPNSRLDLQNLYMKDELDANDPSILLGTAPIDRTDIA